MKSILYLSTPLLFMAVCSIKAQSVQISPASLTTCSGLPVSLTATATGFTPTIYTWSSQPAGLSATGATPTFTAPYAPAPLTYTISVVATDGTISRTVSTTLAVIFRTAPPQLVGPTEPLCAGLQTTLSTRFCQTGPGASIKWSTGQNGPATISVSPTITTVYSMSCLPTGNCPIRDVASTTVVVKSRPLRPTVTASSTTLCAGSSVTLTATGCNPATDVTGWLDGANALTGSTIVVTPTQTNNYRAVCYRGVECPGPISPVVQVVVWSVPTTTVTGLTTVCAGSPITLRAAGCSGGTITWSTGATGNNLVVSPTQTTTYTARCTRVGSCSVVSNAHVVQVSAPTAPQITASTTALCALGGPVSLTATGCTGGTAVWSSGQTGLTQTIRVVQTITVYASCKLPNGCVSPRSNSIVVGVQSLAVSPSPVSINLSNPFSLTVTGCIGGTILWQDPKPGNSTSFVTAGSATPYSVSFTNVVPSTGNAFTVSGAYTLSATCRLSGCANLNRTVQVRYTHVTGAGARVATTESAETPSLVVAPVPFTDELTVWLPDANAPATVSLLDMSGRTQLTRSVSGSDPSVRLSTGLLPAGMYVVTVWQKGRRHIQKVVKQ